MSLSNGFNDHRRQIKITNKLQHKIVFYLISQYLLIFKKKFFFFFQLNVHHPHLLIKINFSTHFPTQLSAPIIIITTKCSMMNKLFQVKWHKMSIHVHNLYMYVLYLAWELMVLLWSLHCYIFTRHFANIMINNATNPQLLKIWIYLFMTNWVACPLSLSCILHLWHGIQSNDEWVFPLMHWRFLVDFLLSCVFAVRLLCK